MTFKSVSTSIKGLVLTGIVSSGAAMISACGSGEDSESATESHAAPATESASEAPADSGGAAEEADGVITASFNGTERTWYITSGERGGQYVSQSDWSSLFADQSNVSIMGHVSPSSFQSGEAIMIGFTLQGTGENPSVADPSVTYLSGGIMNNHSSSHGGNADISVSSASIEGDTLEISGSFSGSLPFKSMGGEADVESQETIAVEGGTFEGQVRRLQD